MLESIISQCNVLESCWRKVERFCDRMPQTLVHGDFTAKNIRVRNRHGSALLPFDWEMAGRVLQPPTFLTSNKLTLLSTGRLCARLGRTWKFKT